MGSYLLVFAVAALAGALCVPLCMRIARRVGALDDTRDPAVPRIGGWAVALGVGLSLVLVGGAFDPTGATLLAAPGVLGAVMLGAVGILVVGSIDDIHPLRARVKFGAQIAIAVGVWLLGVRIQLVSSPVGTLALDPVVSLPVTVLWLVGIANAFNLLDGADGVAAGSAFFASAAVFFVSVTLGQPAIGLVAAALAGGILGFLPFNFPPARAFLGDAGSLVIGFLLAGLAVEGATKGPTLVAIAVPLLAFAVPVFDTTITLLRRAVRGRPLFERDQGHLHHRLAHRGMSPRGVVVVVYVVSAAMALLAMLFVNPDVRAYAVAFIVVGAGIWLAARFLRLHELNELARVAKRGALQPRAIVMNVGLRRAAERLQSAATLQDILAGLALLFERSEFDEVIVIVAEGSDRRGSSRAWSLQEGTFVERWPARRPDEWEVVCPFEGDDWRGELRLRRRLGRRSLLLDLNLLLEIVQPALNEAAQRVHVPVAMPA